MENIATTCDVVQRPPVLNRGVERTEPHNFPDNDIEKPHSQALIDWCSFTLPIPEWTQNPENPRDPADVMEEWAVTVTKWLRLDDAKWQSGPGRYFYTKRLAQEHIEVLYAGMQPGMGIHVQVSGQGCRALEQAGRVTDWAQFFQEIWNEGGKITRLDVALDDHNGMLDMAQIYAAWLAGHAAAHYRTAQPVMPKVTLGSGHDALDRPQTLYFGDPRQGDSGIRIYDKQAEQIAKGQPDPGPWIRVELVMKDRQTTAFVNAVKDKGRSLADAVAGAIRAKLDFKAFNPNDGNKRRWATVDWWARFLGTAQDLPLAPKTATRSITEKWQWLERQASRSLAIVSMAHDNHGSILNHLLMAGAEKLTARDRELIHNYLAASHSENVAI